MNSSPPPRACRVVTSEISARILLAAQLRALDEYAWTVVAGNEMAAPIEGVEHVMVPMRRELALSDAASFVALLRYFRSQRFEFVQTHTPKASMLALPAARLSGATTIYTMHGALFFRGSGRLANVAGWAFERWCCSWAHAVCMQSAEDAKVLPKVLVCPARKVRYQGNGIDLQRFAPLTGEELSARGAHRGLPVVLNISRLVSEKGCLDFFELAERLAGQAEFVHVGPTESDQKDAVDPARMADLGRRGVVRFVGEVHDVRGEMARADVFVLPSYREGIPRACMEAAALGLPVVAYDVRGVREVVPAGLGLLSPRGDVDALTAAVRPLLADARTRETVGAACRDHVRVTFDERLVYERLRAVYAELRDRRARTGSGVRARATAVVRGLVSGRRVGKGG